MVSFFWQDSDSTVSALRPPPPAGAADHWRWVGEGYRRPGGKAKSKKVFYKTIQRGRDQLHVNDSAVFLSTGACMCPSSFKKECYKIS